MQLTLIAIAVGGIYGYRAPRSRHARWVAGGANLCLKKRWRLPAEWTKPKEAK